MRSKFWRFFGAQTVAEYSAQTEYDPRKFFPLPICDILRVTLLKNISKKYPLRTICPLKYGIINELRASGGWRLQKESGGGNLKSSIFNLSHLNINYPF